MKAILAIYLTCIAIFGFSQQYSELWTDINYVGDGQAYHNLDIYLPAEIKDSYPVIIYVYGSAFLSNNSKGQGMNTVGAALLDAGYAVVTPNHRSSSDAIYPAQLHDIKAVIRFVRGNAGKYKFDTAFVGISGSSSGGQASMLAGTTGGITEATIDGITMNLEGNLGDYTSYSSSVDAVVNWFGPVDLLVLDSCGSSMDNKAADSPASRLVGGPIYENESLVKFTNPSTFLDANDPPILLIHGDADEIIPICSSEFFYEDLQEAGVKTDFIVTPGGDHGGKTHIPSNFVHMVGFFDEAKEEKEQAVNTYTLTVTGGQGSGEYEENASVTILADNALEGKEFSKWVGDGASLLDNVESEEVIFAMPAKDITIVAEYKNVEVENKIKLRKGWNLIGCPNKGAFEIDEALSSVWAYVEVVKDSEGFYSKDSDADLNSLSEILFAHGYFVKVSSECELEW